MLSDARFGERRDAIRREIEEEMASMTAEHEKMDVLRLGHDAKGSPKEGQGEPSEEEALSDEEQDEDDDVPSEADSSSEVSGQDASGLRVGVSCAMGRHRSVAMVEVLAQMSWPGWQVEVQHRDVNKKRGSVKKTGGKQSRGTRGGGIPSHFEDD